MQFVTADKPKSGHPKPEYRSLENAYIFSFQLQIDRPSNGYANSNRLKKNLENKQRIFRSPQEI